MPSIWDRVALRTRTLFSEGLRAAGPPAAAGFYDQLIELLVAGDLGPSLAFRVAEGVRRRRPITLPAAQEALAAELAAAMSPRPRGLFIDARPSCVLLYGVNGSGKTTTAGKLAYLLRLDGFNPLVVAADTYRAAALEQMEAWAERAGVPCFVGQPGGDPAAVVFDGLQSAARRGNGVVLVDTAGRMQTQSNLLAELAKVGRVAAKALPGAPHESLLVLDGNLGQSNLAQARGFNQALPISGLVLTKMDGTARGGAVVSIESELGVPTKMIGLGEGPADLAPFDVGEFAHALLGADGHRR
ncbi:MAG TPA: signaling recognition particle receptor family protein [Candidatus Dormibacteraeota bacterium]|nr:signaling recognition particle receptor family protein [Candidatus Dormibacteraeota bacterium]